MPETPRSDTAGDAAYADVFDDDEVENGQAPDIHPALRHNSGKYDEEDDDDEDDDRELAMMFAKVQSIQAAEGIHIAPIQVKTPQSQPFQRLEVAIPDSTKRSEKITPKSSLSSRSRSPAGSTVSKSKSPDGITTISRKAAVGTSMDILSGMKKPVLFQTQLLQTVKQQPQALEQLKQKVVAAAPATIAKRVESLSEPRKKDTGRRFANDDDEKHCRFRVKKKQSTAGGRDAYDDDNGGDGDRTSDFIARMEAAERNRQKKLELTRGEKEYQANLNKKVCPKCDVPQSYTEYRDKKKRCQTCGSEFRVPQAWGDIGSQFISRITDDSRQREEKKEQIRVRVTEAEMSGRMTKTPTQQYYEKTLQQREEHKTFLDRNYSSLAGRATTSSLSASDAKTKRAQAQLQAQLQAQRDKLLAAAQPPIF